ncbi:MAG TPA: DNA recombination protein RmuC, partial [Acidimicrobiia bacterium]
MEIVLGTVVVVLAVTLGVLAVRARARPGALDAAVGRAVQEQRRVAADERDAAVRAAVEQVVLQNREVIGRERELVGQDLATTRSVIDDKVRSMTDEVVRVQELVRELERDRQLKFGELASAIQHSHEQLSVLAETTQGLRQALSSTKARGQWGERMADDVLRLHGLVEGVNYRKQHAIEAGIPDFTFLLPDGLSLHMDVKFPLDNYLRYLDADSELEQRRARDDFLRDVRGHVKSLAARGYSAAAGETVDCVLLFIPNETLYAFIHEQDRTILDDALGQKLVFCSPLTLYAVLAVVRQAVDNFRVERTSNEILARLGAFHKQWTAFVDRMDKLDRSLGTARRDYDELVGTR